MNHSLDQASALRWTQLSVGSLTLVLVAAAYLYLRSRRDIARGVAGVAVAVAGPAGTLPASPDTAAPASAIGWFVVEGSQRYHAADCDLLRFSAVRPIPADEVEASGLGALPDLPMTDLYPFIAVGIATGAIYGIAGLGVVLTYKTSGVFNFAHGAIAMAGAYCYYTLTVTYGSPPWLAMLFTVVVFGAGMGVALDKVLFRRLLATNPAAAIAASIGLLVFVRAVILLTYGGDSKPVPDFLPHDIIEFGPVNFGVNQLIIVGLAAATSLALAVFFRATIVGKAMRAVVDNRDSAELVGIDSAGVVTIGWIIGCAFAAFSGVLLAPLVGLDTLTVPVLVMHAFAAAVMAGLVSMPLAFGAAVTLGVAESVTTKLVANVYSLSGLSQSLPFLVMFVVLFFARGKLFAPRTTTTGVRGRGAGGWKPLSRPSAAVLVVVAVGVPLVASGSRLVTLTNAVVFVTLFASLNLLVGLSRQVSLCHAAFAALGAMFFSHFTGDMPFPLALLLAGVCVVPFGASSPSVRSGSRGCSWRWPRSPSACPSRT